MQQIEQQVEERRTGSSASSPGQPRRGLRRRPPVMTLTLIGINLLMAFGQVAASGGQSFRTLGTIPAKWALGARVSSLVEHGEYWRLITAGFLHNSLTHLLSNMLMLAILGWLLETYYGPVRLLVIFVVGAVAGTIGSYLNVPGMSLGASGGVMALLGALIIHNTRYRPYLPARMNRALPLLISFVLFILLLNQGEPHADFHAHLWGLVGGGVMAAVLEGRIAGSLQDERDWLPLPTAVATAAGLLLCGGLGLLQALPHELLLLRAAQSRRPEVILGNLQALCVSRPYFVEARSFLGDIYLGAGRVDESDRIYDDLVRSRPASRYVQSRAAQHDWLSGNVRQAAHEWEGAAERFKLAAELAGDPFLRAQAQNAYAWTLADHLHRDLGEALKYALLAIEALPDDPAITDTVAWAYYQQGKYPEALAQQTRAVQLWQRVGADNPAAKMVAGWLGQPDPRLAGAELYFHLGIIQQKLGRVDEARQAYQAALRVRPDYPEAGAALRDLTGGAPAPAGPGRKPARPLAPRADEITTT